MIIVLRKFIQEHAAQWLGSILLLVIAFGLFYSPSMKRAAGENNWLFQVNGEKIWQSQLRQQILAERAKRNALRTQYGAYADLIMQLQGVQKNPADQAKTVLVQETVLNQAAHNAGICFSPAYAQENMARIQSSLLGSFPLELFDPYGINPNKLRAWLMHQGLSEKYVEQKITEALQRRMILDLAGQGAYVPTYEVALREKVALAPRTFSILSFSREEVLKKERQKELSAQELKSFYTKENETTKRYWVPEKREAIIWRFKPANYDVTVSDADIKEYYEDNKVKSYLQESAKIQVRHILFKVENDADRTTLLERAQAVRNELVQSPKLFAERAQELSADKATAKDGGLMPFFERGSKERAFDKAAFTLKKDGDISPVITTQEGYEIIERVEKKRPIFKPLSSVKQEIAAKVKDKEFSRAFIRDAKRLMKKTEQGDATALTTFVQRYKATKETLSDIAKNNEMWGSLLFRMEKGSLNFSLEKDAGVIIKLTDIKKRYLPSLESIKEVVTSDLYEHKTDQALRDTLDAAHTRSFEQSLDQIKKDLGGELDQTKALTPEQKEELSYLQKKDIALENMFQIEKVGGSITQITNQAGYIIRLDSFEQNSKKPDVTMQEKLASELNAEEKGLFEGGFVASLARNATLKANETDYEDSIDEAIGEDE